MHLWVPRLVLGQRRDRGRERERQESDHEQDDVHAGGDEPMDGAAAASGPNAVQSQSVRTLYFYHGSTTPAPQALWLIQVPALSR